MKYKKTRAAAQAAGENHYFTGSPCRYGHVALRRTKSGDCTACSRDREKRRWHEQQSYMRAKQKRWREKNPDYGKQRHRRNREEAAGRPMPDACELCEALRGEAALCFDHDHETGEFRGWLCTRCNTALGKLGDTLESLKRAVAYLERAKQEKKNT